MPDPFRWRDEIARRIAPLGLSPAREAEIADELAQHLEDRLVELRSTGLSADDARRAVLAELADDETLAAAIAVGESAAVEVPPPGDDRRGSAWTTLRRDIRYGVRTLRKNPAFSTVAVLTLALGIGANAVIFSAVNTVLLKPLPYRESDRIATFWLSAPQMGLPEVSLPDALFAYYHEHTRTFESLAAYTGAGFTLTQAGEPERLLGANVTIDFFRVFGVKPLHGRTFLPQEETPGNNLVAILSYGLWQRRFRGDTSVIGRALSLNEIATTVVGIMPPGFEFPKGIELWIPLGLNRQSVNSWYLTPIGRLRPGATVESARREAIALDDEFVGRHPEWFPHRDSTRTQAGAMLLRDRLVGDVRRPLLVLFGAVAAVLLIACANIANLLLARASARGREMALRCCLGASPRRIAAQLITESLLLALTGALVGLALAVWGMGALRRFAADQIPLLGQSRIDGRVLAFTIAIALLAGVLFGLAPAVRGARVRLQDALKEGGRGGASAASRRLNNAFVVAQFSLSLVLLVGAGLLLRSFQRLLAVDPGFRAENVVAARLSLPGRRYPSDTLVRGFYERLLPQLRVLPGVRAVGLAQRLPFTGGNPQNTFVVEGREPRSGEPQTVANVRQVTPGYFAAIGTPVLRGRVFAETDVVGAPPVAVVDETLARRYWPNADPIGKRIKRGGAPNAEWMTVVGVVPNVKHRSLTETPDLWLYEPFGQVTNWGNYLVVRAGGDPANLISAIRSEVAAIDPTIPLFDVQTMEQLIDRSLATRRLTNALLAGFALTALLLAAIGIYGVMSVSVGSRIREFGVRLALGAQGRDVVRLVVGEGMLLVAIGTILGLVGALSLKHVLSGLLFGVGVLDPVTLAVVPLILAAAAVTACYLPARRATRADPMAALRAE